MRFCNIEITAIWLVENVFQLLWDLFLQWMELFKLDFVLFIFVLFDIRSSKFCLGQSESPRNIFIKDLSENGQCFDQVFVSFMLKSFAIKEQSYMVFFYSWMARTQDDWQSIRLCLYFKSFPFNIVWQELTLSTSQNIYFRNVCANDVFYSGWKFLFPETRHSFVLKICKSSFYVNMTLVRHW